MPIGDGTYMGGLVNKPVAGRQPSLTPMGCAIFLLFWGGVLAVALIQAVNNPRDHSPAWFMVAALVGAGLMIGLGAYYLLSRGSKKP